MFPRNSYTGAYLLDSEESSSLFLKSLQSPWRGPRKTRYIILTAWYKCSIGVQRSFLFSWGGIGGERRNKSALALLFEGTNIEVF